MDLIGEALGQGIKLVIIPVERLAEDFFQLKTQLAGQIVQKFINYQIRLVVLGDISQDVEQSTALRGCVYETNRGNHVWLLADRQALDERLKLAQTQVSR